VVTSPRRKSKGGSLSTKVVLGEQGHFKEKYLKNNGLFPPLNKI